MAENKSEDQCVTRHEVYPDLEPDLHSAFQRDRVGSAAKHVRAGDRVLDVGCNSGYFVDFVKVPMEYHGIDVNPDLVAKAAARKGVASARVARGEPLPFPDKAFDLVNISEVLEHVHDPEVLIREAARVSRRSVVGDTPHEKGAWGEHRVEGHAWHVMCFTEQKLRFMLEKYGRITYWGTVDAWGQAQCYIFEMEVR